MTVIKVNADYESHLFFGRNGKEIVNHSIEFLAFFSQDKTLITNKKYAQDYFDYIKSVTGKTPQIVSSGEYQNWWGSFTNLEEEKFLNSKLTSAKLENEFNSGFSRVISKMSDLSFLLENQIYLLKHPFGVSGQSILRISKNSFDEGVVEKFIKDGPVLCEPLLKRIYDFSTYVFPNKSTIIYENKVDERFQYKGSIFNLSNSESPTYLSFYNKIDLREWSKFLDELNRVINFYSPYLKEHGFSIDSFVYEENDKLKIRTMSEVNFRRTMGQTAYEIGKKISSIHEYSFFVISLGNQKKSHFSEKLEIMKPYLFNKDRGGVIPLSPGDTRFEIFYILSDSQAELWDMYERVKLLLSESKLAIKI